MAGHGFNLLWSVILFQTIYTFGSDCHWQYFKHYEQKGCTAVLGQNGCPVRFRCDKLSPDDYKTCVHKGKIYKSGENIQDVSACDSCKCEVDKYGSASIECADVDCPDWEAQNKSCYMGYMPNECCPKEICPDDKKTHQTCTHNGVKHKIGEFIETSDPCKSCICTDQWIDENGPGCSSVDCLTGIYAKKIRDGCLSVYRENGCCATEIYCDDIYGAIPTFIDEDVKEDYCYYQGTYYNRGSIAYLKTDKCVTCKCTTPPDFTCLKKTCPPKPSPECKTVYGQCCPNYVCP